MSRSGPESGGLVLRVNQKKWPGFKTDQQKKRQKNGMKWNNIKKNVIWIQLFKFCQKGGGVPLATGSYVSDKER